MLLQLLTPSHSFQQKKYIHIQLPPSKSITNRALLLSSLALGRTKLRHVLRCDDSLVMIGACRALGAVLEPIEDSDDWLVEGVGGVLKNTNDPIFVGAAGTCARFLTAMLCIGSGTYFLTADPQMEKRPMGDLISGLRSLGANIKELKQPGHLPLEIRGSSLKGGLLRIPGHVSSQFISALMMMAPYGKLPLTIEVQGPSVSTSYCKITQSVMSAFGVTVQSETAHRYDIAPGHYRGRPEGYEIEADASSGSYFFALAALHPGQRFQFSGLKQNSAQGDLKFLDLLRRMGCRCEWIADNITIEAPPQLRAVSADMSDLSDVVPTLAVLALFAEGETHLTKISHIRKKESDRISDLIQELKKFGTELKEFEDGLSVMGLSAEKIYNLSEPGRSIEIETYNDHRIAMAVSLVGLKIPGVRIKNPTCVQKSYPNYFEDYFKIISS
ncbi:MAG: 3-phosphoshikimate 1-carboxyvinyltransferase [Oligoflexales bacterium]|nr:3-phosphoshikimate 1-carboxyvinyltransferase [Oligoflexales bacterium]